MHDLTTGERIARNPLPQYKYTTEAGETGLTKRYSQLVGWLNDEWVVLVGAKGFDIVHAHSGRVLWSYQKDVSFVDHANVMTQFVTGSRSSSAMAPALTGQTLWAYKAYRGKRAIMAAVQLPHAEAAKAIAQTQLTDAQRIIEPGMAVRVEIAGSVRHATEMKQNLEKELADTGFVVTDDAETVLQVRVELRPDNIEYFLASPKRTIRRTQELFTTNWVVPGHGKVWQGRQTAGNHMISHTRINRMYLNLDLQASLDRYLIDTSPRTMEFSHVVPLPAASQILGETRITQKGMEPITPATQ